MNILFLDIDGVFIPNRAFALPGQTKPYVTKFDPCVVGMLNRLADKYEIQFVIHSSWVAASALVLQDIYGHSCVKTHMLNQGLNDYFHKDAIAKWRRGSRWLAIQEWLNDHPDVDNYWILDDDFCPAQHMDLKLKLISCDPDCGPCVPQFDELQDLFIRAGVPRRVLLQSDD